MEKFFSKEEVSQAKETSLTALAEHYGYHTKRVGHLYTLAEHDSVRIYNDRTWYRWSRAGNRKECGGSQIDFLVQFCDVDSVHDAIRILLEFQGISADGPAYNVMHRAAPVQQKERKPFILPEAVEGGSYRRAYAYLMKTRGLSQHVVDYFVRDQQILYEDKEYHNLVFVGKDKEGVARYAAKRGTMDIYGKKYKGDVAGNDKNYGINIVNPDSDKLKVFEAAIDLMSYMDLSGDYESNKLVLGMVADNPLIRFLKDYPHIRQICFCLDNDRAGMEAMFGKFQDDGKPAGAGLLWKYALQGYEMGTEIVPKETGCKDWNEYLIYTNEIKKEHMQEENNEQSNRGSEPEGWYRQNNHRSKHRI